MKVRSCALTSGHRHSNSEELYIHDFNSLRPYDAYMYASAVYVITLSSNGLVLVKHHTITWTNDGLLSFWPSEANITKILNKIKHPPLKKIYSKMSSATCPPFSILRVLIHTISAAAFPPPSRLRSPHIYMQVMNINWDSLHTQHPYEERKYIWQRVRIHFIFSPFCLVIWSWWGDDVHAYSAILVLCVGNPLFAGGFPAQTPVKQSFDGFINVKL